MILFFILLLTWKHEYSHANFWKNDSGWPDKNVIFLKWFLSFHGNLPNFNQKFDIFIGHHLIKTKMFAYNAKNF